MVKTMDPFDSATYYDACDDGENLTYDSAEEALQQRLDDCGEPGETLRETIQREAPITVDAYVRAPVPDDWIMDEAERLAASFEESWHEDFGNPDSHYESGRVGEEVRALIEQAVRKHAEVTQVWACRMVASREFTAAELEEMFAEEIAKEGGHGGLP
jgi:hypothetical protein